MFTVVVVEDGAGIGALDKRDFEALARFRFGIRRYLRFSEETVRKDGLTPQQYQLLLALKGFPDREWASVRELAERLQLRHHSVVELINRAQRQDLVERGTNPHDGRSIRVFLTVKGEHVLTRLSALHREQLRRMHAVLTPPTWSDSPAEGAGARMWGERGRGPLVLGGWRVIDLRGPAPPGGDRAVPQSVCS